MTRKLNIGVFGVTGEVGRAIIDVLYDLKFPIGNLFVYAGESAGKMFEIPNGESLEILVAEEADYSKLDLAFWAMSKELAEKHQEMSFDSDCIKIDNSRAFRYVPEIPLVVPRVNGDILKKNKSKLISNPNCTTAIAAIPLYVLNEMAGIKKIIFSTSQSASGAGNGGIEELREQTKDYLAGNEVKHKKFPHQLAFNVIPRIDNVLENKYTREEMKTDWETKKILGLSKKILISSNCNRVSVERAHSEDIIVETRKKVEPEEYRNMLRREPMIEVVDEPENDIYPMPLNASGNYAVQVGRIREPIIFKNGIRMFISGDQIYRGAALNAVEIAFELCKNERLD